MVLDSIKLLLNGEINPKKTEMCSDLLLESHYISPENLSNLEYVRKLVKSVRKNIDAQSGIYAYSVAMFIETDPKKIALATDSCLWYIEKSGNRQARFKGYNRLGISKGQLPEAITFFFKALDEIKGRKEYDQETEIYGLLAEYYRDKSEYIQAIKYQEKALQSAKLSGSINDLRETLNDLGLMYYEKDTASFGKAEQFFKEALGTFKSEEEKKKATIYPLLLMNLAGVYEMKKNYDLALESVNEALLLAIEYEDVRIQIEACKHLGFIYQKKKEFEKSEKYFLQGLDLLPKLASNVENDRGTYFLFYYYLADTYYGIGDYKKATEYYSKAKETYQLQYETQAMYESRELESLYKEEEEEQRISRLNNEIYLKKIQTYVSIAASILLSIGVFFAIMFFRGKLKIFRQKEKIVKEQAELLKIEKEKAEINTQLLEEQVKLQEYQKKLRIQESERLVGELEEKELIIRHKNNILEEIEQQLIAEPVLKPYKNIINSIILQEKRVDASFEEFETSPSEFYKKLQEKSGNKLTHLDLQYCTYIGQKISSRKIADLLHVEPHTVRVSKYRLKQKLGLSREEDLNQFIGELYSKYNGV